MFRTRTQAAFLFASNITLIIALSVVLISITGFSHDACAQQNSARGAISRANSSPSGWSNLFKDFSFGYFNISSAPVDQVHDQAARVQGYNYFTFDYGLTKDRRVSLRPVFFWGSAGTDYADRYRGGDFSFGDLIVLYTEQSLLRLPWGVSNRLEFGVHLPTSEISKSSGQITRLTPKMKFEKSLTQNIGLFLEVEPEYYVQRRTTFVDTDGRYKGTRDYGYMAKLEAEYRFVPEFALAVSYVHDQEWSHSSVENFDASDNVTGRKYLNERYHQEIGILAGGAKFYLQKLFMIAGIQHRRDHIRPRAGYRFFNPDESEYFLLSSYRF